MDLKLKGKKALITGSTEGIGLAIAKALALEGAAVYINGRHREKVESVIRELKKSGLENEPLAAPFDLSEKEAVEQLISFVPSLDILINNLGIYEEMPFDQIKDDDWLRFFNINVLSGIRLCRHYFPKMIEKNWGRVVFISSESGVHIPKEMIHYGVTKTAQIALARGLAETTSGTDVTVNSVLPGPTLSPGVQKFVQEMASSQRISVAQVEKTLFQDVRPSSLLQRFESPEEIAAVVAFVCSPLSSAINGASIRAEGGIVRSII